MPAYSTLCRRMGNLILPLSRDLAGKKDVHVVVDSTGLKIFGEGEWKVRTHGHSKRRTWRKLHLAVDESDNQILAVVLTTNDFKDNEVLPDLMEQLD
ncbi:MAG: transposase [Bdellovibrionia bacterium]